MGRRSLFAQILDEKLCAPERSESRGFRPRSETPHTAPAHPLLFAAPYRALDASAYSSLQTDGVAAPRRMLATREQHALSALNRFGARLTADFTAVELRRAFRGLARQYHPDRHPLSDHAAQVQMARLFGEIVEHHRQLTGAVAGPGPTCPG